MNTTQYISTPNAATGKLAQALALADLGYRVFPCWADQKHSRIKKWKMLATSDPEQIGRWWRMWPDSNIGILCGEDAGFLVIDADGEFGQAKVADLEREHGALPRTRTVTTPRGGRHFHFQYPAGFRIKNSVGKIAPRVDIRAGHSGAAGLAIFYRWDDGLGSDDVPIAELPPAWAALLDDPPEPEPERQRDYGVDDVRKMKRCRAYLKTLGPSISGSGGHNAILRAACECYRFGCDDSMALNLLHEYNQRSDPKWSEADLKRKLSEAKSLVGSNAGSRLGGGI